MRILKIIGLSLLLLITIGIIGTFLVIKLIPAFGQAPSDELKTAYANSINYDGERFVNLLPTSMEMSFSTMRSVIKDYIKGIPDHQPHQPLPVLKPSNSEYLQISDTITQLIWFGHSAFLYQTNGKNILIDPMLGSSPSPIPVMGSQRFTEGLPIEIENLPEIDFIIISHDHYDHLDYPTLMQLKEKVKTFIVPLGVSSHLLKWGFVSDQITTLDWWDSVSFEGLTFSCVPARHFSGRGLTDRDQTLWSSWVISSPDFNVYFSGDGGYGDHFKTIGERYGPFDLALMECGQYDERWKLIHMLPEETVQAAIDVKAKAFMPIHWGAFVLALHSWYDSVDRASLAANKQGIPIALPQIGEIFKLEKAQNINTPWWVEYK
jgi:L-ascorbate metabolism protein UlaG (beta-lactamase superfamily)